ncbi:MAG: fasciclin domain-containing protein [Bacteroidia bacterium]
MKTIIKSAVMAFVMTAVATNLNAQDNVVVGGMQMYPTKNIIENAVNSKDHTTLVAAVKAAGLVEALQGAGPFTVFAPTNDAFENLPAGTVETLLKKENKDQLVSILTYHVVAGKYDSKTLEKAIKDGKGQAKLKTLQGAELIVSMNGPRNFVVQDGRGVKANITIEDVNQSNGVINVLDTVLLPGS